MRLSSALASLAFITLLLPLAACGREPQHPRNATPDAAAIAAGAPLSATLLAQLDEYEQDWCGTAPKKAGECRVALDHAQLRDRFPELERYVRWVDATKTCSYDQSRGSYVSAAGGHFPTLSQMRERWRLDAYVAGVEWCGNRRPGR